MQEPKTLERSNFAANTSLARKAVLQASKILLNRSFLKKYCVLIDAKNRSMSSESKPDWVL